MSPVKVVVGWHGSGADCSERRRKRSASTRRRRVSGSEAADDFQMIFSNFVWWVTTCEVARLSSTLLHYLVPVIFWGIMIGSIMSVIYINCENKIIKSLEPDPTIIHAIHCHNSLLVGA
jgi:hypothetical protein